MKDDYMNIPIPKNLVEIIDHNKHRFGYRSRSEFVRDAIRRRLEELGALRNHEDKAGEGV